MDQQHEPKSTAQKIPLFSKITLFDLLQLEEKLPPSHSLLYTYINTLTPLLQSIPAALPSEAVILQPTFTTVLQGPSPIIIYTSSADLEATRVNMKMHPKQIQSFQIPSPYVLVPLIKLWQKFKSDLFSFIDKLNYSSLTEESIKEIEVFIYNKVGLDRVFKLKEELGNIGTDSPRLVVTFTAQRKSVIDISLKRASPGESLRYTESEEIEQMEELSFRISDVLKDKFPRFSAASLTVLDTPGKELKRSYLEYNEILESPQVLPGLKTPIDSPRQASLTISQIKERFETSSESLQEKNKLEMDSEVIRSLHTEFTGCSETKQHIPYESKTRSCQCSSCIII